MDILEIIKEIEHSYDIRFEYNERMNRYQAKISKDETIDLRISRYNTIDENNGKEFIGFGYDKYMKQGIGCPCDSIEEVMEYIGYYVPERKQLSMWI